MSRPNTTVLVPTSTLAAIPGWSDLDISEHTKIEQESRALAQSLLGWGQSRLAIGEHLTNLQSILEPKKMFSKYLKLYNLRRSTAYKCIHEFRNAKSTLPEPVLRIAMARGFNMLGESPDKPLGVYTHVVKALPPPKNGDPEAIHEWLNTVEAHRKKGPHSVHKVDTPTSDKETVVREVYRFFESRFERLPNSHKSRAYVVDMLVGMFMSKLGVASKTFGAVAPPDFRSKTNGREAAA